MPGRPEAANHAALREAARPAPPLGPSVTGSVGPLVTGSVGLLVTGSVGPLVAGSVGWPVIRGTPASLTSPGVGVWVGLSRDLIPRRTPARTCPPRGPRAASAARR